MDKRRQQEFEKAFQQAYEHQSSFLKKFNYEIKAEKGSRKQQSFSLKEK